jgi:hypothetical protein
MVTTSDAIAAIIIVSTSRYPRGMDDPKLIEAVDRSRVLVAEHDREAWVGLFAFPGEVEDPVGSLPCRRRPGGDDEVGPFYDTYIAPNKVDLEVHDDVTGGLVAVRDVTIHTTLATGARLDVPAYVVYAMSREGDGLRIRRLAAYWEIVPMVLAVLRQGWVGVRTLLQVTGRILRFQGLRGLWAYKRAILFGVRRSRGRALASAFIDTFNRANPDARTLILKDCAGAPLPPIGPDARMEAGKLVCAGRMVVLRVWLRDGERSRSGICFLRTGWTDVESARFYFKE